MDQRESIILWASSVSSNPFQGSIPTVAGKRPGCSSVFLSAIQSSWAFSGTGLQRMRLPTLKKLYLQCLGCTLGPKSKKATELLQGGRPLYWQTKTEPAAGASIQNVSSANSPARQRKIKAWTTDVRTSLKGIHFWMNFEVYAKALATRNSRVAITTIPSASLWLTSLVHLFHRKDVRDLKV